ncbi:hypothetical protein VE00_06563 [Pseudogymnoascus sp. WSF 3629]|nr:hypothetical protein VE00_06563 [Pseudogymnoascus sp. WSF 3629]
MKDGPHTLMNPRFTYSAHYWGFVIIRTTYTPESDLQWPVAMAKLNDWLRLEMKSMSNASVPDQDRVIKKFKNLVADDKTLYDGLPMSDAVLRFEDILEEQFNTTLEYSSPEHFYKTWQYRIPELVEQSLVESDPEVKQDLLQASYWRLNEHICLVIDEEVLKDLVELPCLMPPRFDLAKALKAIRENPDGPPPIIDKKAYLKVAMRHAEFDLMSRREGYTAENPDWYAQWAKWEVCNGLGQMHRSIQSCVLDDGGMELELRDGEPYVEIYGQD